MTTMSRNKVSREPTHLGENVGGGNNVLTKVGEASWTDWVEMLANPVTVC